MTFWHLSGKEWKLLQKQERMNSSVRILVLDLFQNVAQHVFALVTYTSGNPMSLVKKLDDAKLLMRYEWKRMFSFLAHGHRIIIIHRYWYFYFIWSTEHCNIKGYSSKQTQVEHYFSMKAHVEPTYQLSKSFPFHSDASEQWNGRCLTFYQLSSPLCRICVQHLLFPLVHHFFVRHIKWSGKLKWSWFYLLDKLEWVMRNMRIMLGSMLIW